MPLPVYVDFDDVLCETARALTVLLEREFGKRVDFENIHTFNLATSFELNEADLVHLMDAAHEPDFLSGLIPSPGALEGMRAWASAGCQVFVVTGRPASTHDCCERWLRRYAVPYGRLIFVDKYGRNFRPGGSAPTLSLAELQRMEFALAVEDAPHMADHLMRHHTMPVAVIERPWNRHATIGDDIRKPHRCRDWAQLLELFPAPGVGA